LSLGVYGNSNDRAFVAAKEGACLNRRTARHERGPKSMNRKQNVTEKDPTKQLKDFSQQPAKTKELELMEDHAEKSTGQERLATDRKIRAKAGRANPPR
jgi:hypothetical protein